jgi:AraC-like DNA-binding protein
VTRYRELAPPPELSEWVRCLWVDVGEPGDEPGPVVPDGCLDLIWIGGHLVVAGPDDRPVIEPFMPAQPATVTGIRFRPGRAGPLLGAPPGAMRNRRVALSDLGPSRVDSLAQRLADTGDRPGEVLALLAAEVRARAADAPEADAVATAAVDRLLASAGTEPVAALTTELGVSERHLRRRTTEALGYGPKTFARIVRFQRALAMLHAGDRSLADVAATAGYTDQSHLNRDVTALAGRTPGLILAGSSKTPPSERS